ncbi:MAG: glycosyl transferase family 8 [Hyphomonadaceae bacterium]
MADSETIDEARVFVGSDRSQLLAVKVLDFSIRRRTDMKVAVRSMHDVELPDPKDIRQGKRTGFSFTRFAIPQLSGFTGRALYLDADMLVLRDLRELYAMPFNGAKVHVQAPPPETADKPAAPKKRVRQSSVMLLDCAALRWDPLDIIAGLDGRYTYEELMQQLCILAPEEIGEGVPFEWNSLETYIPGRTGLIHYTDMPTQPWVHVANRNGWLWINEVRDMIDAGVLTRDEIAEEVRLGYFRPSLLEELALPRMQAAPEGDVLTRLRAIDADAGYVQHAEVHAQNRRRAEAVAQYKAAQSVPAAANGLADLGKRALAALGRRLRPQ